jgi:hypothetical protein
MQGGRSVTALSLTRPDKKLDCPFVCKYVSVVFWRGHSQGQTYDKKNLANGCGDLRRQHMWIADGRGWSADQEDPLGVQRAGLRKSAVLDCS